METERPVLLSNYEVLLMINDRQAAREKRFAKAIGSKTTATAADSTASTKKTALTRRGTRSKDAAAATATLATNASIVHDGSSNDRPEQTLHAYQLPLPRNVATLELELQKYLQESACANYTSKSVHQFLSHLSKYPLTKAERLQILNNRPTNTAVLYPLIEEIEERLSEEQMEEIVELVTRHLPAPPQPPESNDNTQMQE
jgi:hypothetical protein